MEAICDIEQLRAAVQSLTPEFDIDKVYLFGSFAKGRATPNSDIDLCVETCGNFSLMSAARYSNKIQGLTGRKIDLVTQNSLYPHVRESMLKDRKLLYERA